MRELEETQADLAEAHEALMVVIAERDALKGAVEKLSARHQPKAAQQFFPCDRHLGGDFLDQQNCPDCRAEPVTVCSNLTCCTWPCEDRKAIDAALGGAS